MEPSYTTDDCYTLRLGSRKKGLDKHCVEEEDVLSRRVNAENDLS